MSNARYIVGDSLTTLRTLPDASVDLVLTSPPFLALRSYLPADHPDKASEMGSEGTPGAFIDALLDIVEECRRVLAPHGSLCVELGDTYSGSGGGGGDYLPGGLREDQPGFGGSAEKQRDGNAAHWRQKNAQRSAWPLDKSLCLIPELFRIALVYGTNPLTGRTTPPWRARNVVRWVRPNPPVGALGDKFRPATSEMIVACTSARRWFDLDAVRTPHQRENNNNMNRIRPDTRSRADDAQPFTNDGNPAGAPPLDWWQIPTAPYAGAHYATFPPDLCGRPIAAMCPLRVCTTCGEPSRRIVEPVITYRSNHDNDAVTGNNKPSRFTNPADRYRNAPTLGWTDCGHGTWRTGIVLDPFAGSGTTLAVATGHGRDAIGIDLDSRNADLAQQRIGMFCTIETPANL